MQAVNNASPSVVAMQGNDKENGQQAIAGNIPQLPQMSGINTDDDESDASQMQVPKWNPPGGAGQQGGGGIGDFFGIGSQIMGALGAICPPLGIVGGIMGSLGGLFK